MHLSFLYRPCVAAHSDEESAPFLTDNTLAFLLFRVHFFMHYKLGKTTILADALSRRPDYDFWSALSRQEVDNDEDDDRCATCVSLNLTCVSPKSCLFDEIVTTYANDPYYDDIIAYLCAPTDAALRALIADQTRLH